MKKMRQWEDKFLVYALYVLINTIVLVLYEVEGVS